MAIKLCGLEHESEGGKVLSYYFSYNISISLFHEKKCCNCINSFLVFLWDLFVIGLVLCGGDLIKIVKSHMRSTC